LLGLRLAMMAPHVIPDLIRDPASLSRRGAKAAGPRIKSGVTEEETRAMLTPHPASRMPLPGGIDG